MGDHAVRLGQWQILLRGVPLFAGRRLRGLSRRDRASRNTGASSLSARSRSTRGICWWRSSRRRRGRRAGHAVQLARICNGAYIPSIVDRRFGQKRPTALIYNLLRDNMGRQAAFDAITPERWSGERPEIMIPLPHGGATPPIPTLDRPLEVGAQVRILRRAWDGLIGEVVELPTHAGYR